MQLWKLSWTKVEVIRGGYLPEPPQERGGACRLQASDPALLCFMRTKPQQGCMSVGSRRPVALLGRNSWKRRICGVL